VQLRNREVQLRNREGREKGIVTDVTYYLW
jgi:hypothetical protein